MPLEQDSHKRTLAHYYLSTSFQIFSIEPISIIYKDNFDKISQQDCMSRSTLSCIKGYSSF